ncbi:hypothetical protein A8E25_07785 [Burkholderia cenocepacia]|nr:hypothetical protein A8E17_38910 [Burkholderia cenocepacia]ONR75157.1 hypothetical protein A8E23_08535 [Burkholderia cenocepacia]ONR78022.1 hypothetical protein A8E18_04735 [Burkholderia cenocepacia]ONR85412.1 hypothetical protein A8E22_06995 [Burkholderia cenocepacia]ONR96031.1 hypothetical protein A8E20_24705 [Burkholderia cenocepacia]
MAFAGRRPVAPAGRVTRGRGAAFEAGTPARAAARRGSCKKNATESRFRGVFHCAAPDARHTRA